MCAERLRFRVISQVTTHRTTFTMAGMLEALYCTSGFTSEASLSGHRLHTPPCTPHRATKRRLERADSPASTVGSVHPADTHSPAKKAAKRSVPDNITVEELAEGDAGYSADIDVVYPEELEENDSDNSDSDRFSDTEEDESEGLPEVLSNLHVNEERAFWEGRNQKRSEKRASLRSYKRSHSQSVKSDAPDPADIDAKNDHDHKSGQRRQRRRVQGPRETGLAHEIPLPSSPEPGGYNSAVAECYVEENHVVSTTETEAMDVGDAK
ncbi:hypothetical protein DOTSEDRAFT_73358 [Dothistroma septosporum NZE10]|uniref:Uncharacterized protein n=1 Tax=Dothistroma septosporum (strain NZE10 / CBS 128990) TaxID=675120 RepID=N1PMA5_DOTSN|nr:hypothetical protein DOTSEDRAFT_73358 [Dothistroma septosporum NZE10]